METEVHIINITILMATLLSHSNMKQRCFFGGAEGGGRVHNTTVCQKRGRAVYIINITVPTAAHAAVKRYD
jgi:hypothetical protein